MRTVLHGDQKNQDTSYKLGVETSKDHYENIHHTTRVVPDKILRYYTSIFR